jgi:hypothetical protein
MSGIDNDALRRAFTKRFAIEEQVLGQPSTFPCRSCGARPDLKVEDTALKRSTWYAAHRCAQASTALPR